MISYDIHVKKCDGKSLHAGLFYDFSMHFFISVSNSASACLVLNCCCCYENAVFAV